MGLLDFVAMFVYLNKLLGLKGFLFIFSYVRLKLANLEEDCALLGLVKASSLPPLSRRKKDFLRSLLGDR